MVLSSTFPKNMVLYWKCKKHGNTNVNVQKTWYYQSTFPKNMVLWWKCKKHGNTNVKVQKTGIIKVYFQNTWYYGENVKTCNTNVKSPKTWYYQVYFQKNMVLLWWKCQKHGNTNVKVKKNGIIKVHFQKTWYYYGENAKNMKIQKWHYHDTSANTMVL